jgi:hypothetical protein
MVATGTKRWTAFSTPIRSQRLSAPFCSSKIATTHCTRVYSNVASSTEEICVEATSSTVERAGIVRFSLISLVL